MPVSGKAKRPAVRPSVDYATYGHESGWRQGLQLHITNAPSGSFLVFLLARLAVSAMADEARLAPVNGHRRRCSSLSKVPDADSANEVVSGRNRLPGAISHRKARSRDRAWIGGFNSPVIQPAKTAFIVSLATVLAKLWSRFLHSNVRSARPFGSGTIPTTIMRQPTGLRCSILYIAGNLKPLWRSGAR